MNKIDKRHEILTEPFAKLIIKLCVPAIIGMIIIALYSFMDSIYAGQMISKYAMAAIGIAYPFTLINNSISVLFGMGGASVLSRAIGARDEYHKQSVLPSVSFLVIISSLIITVVGYCATEWFVQLANPSPEIAKNTIQYLKIIFLGSVFINLTQALNMLMRAEGRMIRAMSIMCSGALLNIILDPIFILLFPSLGVQAVAYATIISQIFQCVLTLIYFLYQSPQIKWKKPHLYPGMAKAIIPIGISGMIMQFATMIQQTLLFQTAGTYGGETYQIILSALLRIQMFAFIPLWGASQGFQPFVGTNFGAKQYLRLLQGRRAFMLFAFLLSLVFFLPMQIIPHHIVSWFIDDPSLVQKAIYPARAIFSTFFLYGFLALLGIYFQAIGHAKTAAIFVMGRNLILFIPVVLLLPKIFGAPALWWTFACCDLPIIIYIFVVYIRHGQQLKALSNDSAADISFATK